MFCNVNLAVDLRMPADYQVGYEGSTVIEMGDSSFPKGEGLGV